MNVEMMDEEGTRIQGTFFKEMVEKFNHLLFENSVYLISGAVVRESPPKFATVKHEYCIVFDKNTTIEQIDDDG